MIKRQKLSQTNLYDEAGRRLKELKSIKKEKEFEIQKAPPGKVHIVRRNNSVQYYLRSTTKEVTGKYIHKSEQRLIKTYLQKKYNEKLVKLLNREIENIESFLNHYNNESEQIKQLYSVNPVEIKNMIIPVDCTVEDYIRAWESIPYIPKEISDKLPVYITERGERVRSKSEVIIANTLYHYHIPYKYECPLKLKNGRTIYPDFTILDVKRRQVVYWEHRGMMDDRDYVKHSLLRIKDYSAEGIMLGDRLIISEEAGYSPLGSDEVKAIVEHYFI